MMLFLNERKKSPAFFPNLVKTSLFLFAELNVIAGQMSCGNYVAH